MPLTCRVSDSIDKVDLIAWEQVRAASNSPIFMDPRLVRAVERGMKAHCRFWHIIVHDDDLGPVACASLTAMTIDLAELADPRLGWIMRQLPGILSRFRKLRMLCCGLPGSPGAKCLALTAKEASASILSQLDQMVSEIAAANGMDLIVYKEFGAEDVEWMLPLSALGYRNIPTPPMHTFPSSFPDFAHYCAALKARYRKQINRSTRKLRDAGGVELCILTDPHAILRVYTPEVHDLYRQMAVNAEINLEILPIEFFHELALRLDGEIELIALSKDSRIIACGWCWHAGSTYRMLYAGLDYRLNDELDLYFNLVYAGLDRALRTRAARIEVGQSANAFKARLGCHGDPLHIYAKGLGKMMSWIVRYGADFLVAKTPEHSPSNVFRSGTGSSGNER